MYGETGREYTEEDWSSEDKSLPYEKSKLLAERKAWEFVEKLDEGKKFELATILSTGNSQPLVPLPILQPIRYQCKRCRMS